MRSSSIMWAGPKSNHESSQKTHRGTAPRKEGPACENGGRDYGDSATTLERLQPPEAARGNEQSPLDPWRKHSPVNAWISDFRPPGL